MNLNHEPIGLFPYLLNKHRELLDIQIDFSYKGKKNHNKGVPVIQDNNKGLLTVFSGHDISTKSIVLINDNQVKFLVDEFVFENDDFGQHVLEMSRIKQHPKNFSMLLDYVHFGKHRLRCAIDNEMVMMRLLKKQLGTFEFPYFNYKEYNIIKDTTHYYQTSIQTKYEGVEKCRSLCINKAHELINKCQFQEDSLSHITTTINMKSSDIKFDINLILNTNEQRTLLEYVFNHYDELNTPLYSSIIKNSEQFTSKILQMDVFFNNREIVKSFLDLVNMTTI